MAVVAGSPAATQPCQLRTRANASRSGCSIASTLEIWAHEHAVELLFIQPGKPTQNAFIEVIQFPRSRRASSSEPMSTIFEVFDGAEAWRRSRNHVHPHSSLGGMIPEEFLELYEITQPPQKSLAA